MIEDEWATDTSLLIVIEPSPISVQPACRLTLSPIIINSQPEMDRFGPKYTFRPQLFNNVRAKQYLMPTVMWLLPFDTNLHKKIVTLRGRNLKTLVSDVKYFSERLNFSRPRILFSYCFAWNRDGLMILSKVAKCMTREPTNEIIADVNVSTPSVYNVM